jgi:hypothetical protein
MKMPGRQSTAALFVLGLWGRLLHETSAAWAAAGAAR